MAATPKQIYDALFVNFEKEIFPGKPPSVNTSNVVYLDDRTPAKYSYNMVSGETAYVPFGAGTDSVTLFGVSGMTVTELPEFDTYSKSISAISQADPCVVTITNHGLTTGERIKFSSIVGMTELNGTSATVKYIDDNNVSLVGVDSTGFMLYISGGTIQRYYSHVTAAQASAAKYIFFSSDVYYTDYIDEDRDVVFSPRGSRVGKSMFVQGGYSGFASLGYSQLNWNASAQSGATRSHVKFADQKNAVVVCYNHLNNAGGPSSAYGYGDDVIKFGNTGNVPFMPKIYIYDNRGENNYSKASDPDPDYLTLHSDTMQPDGKFLFCIVYKLTGSTYYQGIFADPQAVTMGWLFKDINIKYPADAPSTAVHALVPHLTLSNINLTNDIWPDMIFDNVWAQAKPTGGTFATRSVMPQSDSTVIPSILSVDPDTGRERVSFLPETNIYGYIRESDPDTGATPIGDFANAKQNCGETTFIRETASRDPAYFDTENMVTWTNFQHYQMLDNRTHGKEQPTQVYELAPGFQENTYPITDFVSQYTNLKGRNGLRAYGAGEINYGASTLGTEAFLANTGEGWLISLIAGPGTGTLFAKGDQIRLHVSGGNLYGVCRGASTLIKTGVPTAYGTGYMVRVEWDGTTLTYRYNNETAVTGNVGTDAENGLDILLGNNNGADYLDGVIYELIAFSTTKDSEWHDEYWTHKNLFWDFTQTKNVRIPENPEGLSAAVNGSNMRFSFTPCAYASDLPKLFYGHLIRWKQVGDPYYTTNALVSASSSPIDIPLATLGTGDFVARVISVGRGGFSDFDTAEEIEFTI